MYKVVRDKLNSHKERGAVSLFVVLFAAFLFVAVTVGFTILMVSDQDSATDNDLAQSARDSAEAGIEEAKRVLAQLEACQQGGAADVSACARIEQAVRAGECNTVNAAIGASSAEEETLVVKDEGSGALDDAALEQAFTCVRISPDTPSYEGRLDDESDMRVVPIRAVDDVASIRVSWVKQGSESGGDDTDRISPSHNSIGLDVEGESGSSIWEQTPPSLPEKDSWNSYGSILRVGSFQYASGVMNLAEIDNNSRTAFLYPTTSGGGDVTNFFAMDDVDKHTNPQFRGDDERNRITSIVDEGNIPQNIRCDTPSGSTTGQFLCNATFTLPSTIDSSEGDIKTYLTLSSMYNSTDFRVELLDSSGQVVRFQNVQPEIDVTGRANNVFRRLVARVESADANQAPYPRAALGSFGSVCKAYMITDSADEYVDYRSESCPDVRIPGNYSITTP